MKKTIFKEYVLIRCIKLLLSNNIMVGKQITQSSHFELNDYAQDTDRPMTQTWNFFDNSGFALNIGRPLENFANFDSFAVKEIDLGREGEVRLLQSSFGDKDYFTYPDEESPFVLLPFSRGTSDLASSPNDKQPSSNPSFGVDLTMLERQNDILNTKPDNSTPASLQFFGQELRPDSIYSQTQNNLPNKKSTTPQNSGLLAKNVTKNIGKHLIRFTWRSRNMLEAKLKPSPLVWEQLMTLIRVWKKENNITRQFLLNKWGSPGQQFALFRVIAHHYFRKHCMAAIFKSNIKQKLIHIERISKFDQAISDPKALDYLS